MSCQHSLKRSIFELLAHLCWPFIHAFSVKVSLLYLFPFFQNMRQSTVTTKISRNQNLSGCTFTFTLVLKISSSQNRFFFWKPGYPKVRTEVCRNCRNLWLSVKNPLFTKKFKNSFISLKCSSFIPKSYSESLFQICTVVNVTYAFKLFLYGLYIGVILSKLWVL